MRISTLLLVGAAWLAVACSESAPSGTSNQDPKATPETKIESPDAAPKEAPASKPAEPAAKPEPKKEPVAEAAAQKPSLIYFTIPG